MGLSLSRRRIASFFLPLCFSVWALSLFVAPTSGYAEERPQKQTKLPREFQGISLLMSVEEVKTELKKLGLKISEEDIGSHPLTGFPHHFIVVMNPTREFTSFAYSFYEGKLYYIRILYNTETNVDFDQFLSKLKEKYGEPNEVLDKSETLFGIKAFIYRWRDQVTQLQVGYSPAGKVPIFGQEALAGLDWAILDQNLAQKNSEEGERATQAFKERREREEKLKEERAKQNLERKEPGSK